MSDTAAHVTATLGAAGLVGASEEEHAAFAELYDLLRPGVQAMYAVPEARYEAPALLFRAKPPLGIW